MAISLIPPAGESVSKDKEQLLAFYDFAAEHWQYIRAFNPIESNLATVRLRADTTRGCVAQRTILAMVYKLAMSAEKKWRKLRGFKLLAEIIRGVQFKDGEPVTSLKESELNRAVI